MCPRTFLLLQRLGNQPFHLKSWLWKHCFAPKMTLYIKAFITGSEKTSTQLKLSPTVATSRYTGKSKKAASRNNVSPKHLPSLPLFQPRLMRFLWI